MRLLPCLLFCLASIFCPRLLAKKQGCQPTHNLDDWVIQDSTESLCNGYYQPFIPIDTHYFRDESDFPIHIEFDASTSRLDGISTFFNATATQGKRTLTAHEINIHRKDSDWETLTATGNVVFHQPNISVAANQAFYQHADRYLELQCADMRWYPRHARAYSSKISLYSDRHIVLQDSSFTTCPPDNQSWRLQAKQIKLYPDEGRAKAKHMHLRVFDIPVFYWPYLDYPIDNKRHSGFLFPSIASSSQSGISVTVPYYFNLAPNYDLILALSGYGRRGAGVTSQFRYINPHTTLNFDMQYLPDDGAYQKFKRDILQSIPSGYTSADPRIQGLRDHNYRFGTSYLQTIYWEKWLLDINYQYVSDDNYFVDLGSDILSTSTIHLPQRASLHFNGDHWFHTVKVEEYQVLQAFKGDVIEEIYRRQPQWLFEADYPGLMGSLYFKLNGEIVHFTHPGDPVLLQSKVQGHRAHIQPSISLPIRRDWWEWIPTLYADWLGYDLNLKNTGLTIDEGQNRFAPIYTMDGKLIFERPLSLFEGTGTQTLIPRIFYTYIPYRNQSQHPNFDSGIINFSYAQLYRYNRFSGRDFLNEANQISVSLNTQILDGNAFEWFRIGIGEIFYFTPQRVFLCDHGNNLLNCDVLDTVRSSRKHSNLLSEFVFSTPSDIQTGAFVEWGINSEFIEQASVFLHLPLANQWLLNFNYYFTRHDTKDLNSNLHTFGRLHQADASVLMPVTNRINLLARAHYDFEFSQMLEMLGGIEYNSCCFAGQLVFSRYRQLGNELIGREFANQIMLQFVFKGLSSVALNSVDNKLERKIPGYKPLAERVALPKV